MNLRELESRRVELFEELSRIGDMRRGSIAENYRRCGKSGCACAQKGNSGHGPQYLLMTKEEGRSRARNLRAGTELETVKEQVGNHLRFRELVQEIVRVSEQICEEKLKGATSQQTESKKNLKRSSTARPRRS